MTVYRIWYNVIRKEKNGKWLLLLVVVTAGNMISRINWARLMPAKEEPISYKKHNCSVCRRALLAASGCYLGLIHCSQSCPLLAVKLIPFFMFLSAGFHHHDGGGRRQTVSLIVIYCWFITLLMDWLLVGPIAINQLAFLTIMWQHMIPQVVDFGLNAFRGTRNARLLMVDFWVGFATVIDPSCLLAGWFIYD